MSLRQWIQMQSFGWVLLWICSSTAFCPCRTAVRITRRSVSSSRPLFPTTTTTTTIIQQKRRSRQSILRQVVGSDPNESSSCPLTRLSRRLQSWIRTVWTILTFPTRVMTRWISAGTTTNVNTPVEPTMSAGVSLSEDVTAISTTPTVMDTVIVMEQSPMDVLEPTIVIQPSLVVEQPPPVVMEPPNDIQPLSTTSQSNAAAQTVDLSGDWTILVSEEFKTEYDEYLKQLGQPMLVRSIALGIISRTTEFTQQTNNGRDLFIRGTNARGVWERTLVADPTTSTIITTADAEPVQATAWWTTEGTVHHSWLRGVTKYGGGDFESKRYLEQNGKVLVTESTFHPADTSRRSANVTWRFLRKGEESVV